MKSQQCPKLPIYNVITTTIVIIICFSFQKVSFPMCVRCMSAPGRAAFCVNFQGY